MMCVTDMIYKVKGTVQQACYISVGNCILPKGKYQKRCKVFLKKKSRSKNKVNTGTKNCRHCCNLQNANTLKQIKEGRQLFYENSTVNHAFLSYWITFPIFQYVLAWLCLYIQNLANMKHKAEKSVVILLPNPTG